MTITERTLGGAMPAIARTSDHRYIDNIEGTGTHPGVTNILQSIWKGHQFDSWRDRTIAEAAVALHLDGTLARLIETIDEKGAVAGIANAAKAKRDRAGRMGTEIHSLAELVVNGKPTPPMEIGIRERVLKYAQWWEKSKWQTRITEAAILRPPALDAPEKAYGYGGTFDLLAYDAEHRTTLADVKSGGLHREHILQLAAYGMGKYLSPLGDSIAYPMPLIERYVLLQVTEEGVREVDVPVGSHEQMAFLAVLDIFNWVDMAKGRKL